MTYQSDMDKCW